MLELLGAMFLVLLTVGIGFGVGYGIGYESKPKTWEIRTVGDSTIIYCKENGKYKVL